jgi:hypothetical protein
LLESLSSFILAPFDEKTPPAQLDDKMPPVHQKEPKAVTEQEPAPKPTPAEQSVRVDEQQRSEKLQGLLRDYGYTVPPERQLDFDPGRERDRSR